MPALANQKINIMSDTIITPKDAIQRVIASKTKAISGKPYENSFQKKLFFGALILLLLGAVCGMALYYVNSQALGYFAIVSIYSSTFLLLLLQLSFIWPLVGKLKHVEAGTTEHILNSFNSDIELISGLATDFEKHHLEYARDSFQSLSKQLKSKVSLIIGALEKVGIIPLAITAYFGLQKVMTASGKFKFESIEWLFIGFTILYAVAIHIIQVADNFEKLKLIYERAISLQESQHEKGN